MNRYVSEGMTPRDAAMRAGRELAAAARAAAAVERRNALLNLQQRVARRARMVDAAEGDLKAKDGAGLTASIRNQMEATSTPTRGGAFSAEAIAKARTKEYYGGVEAELRKAGLLNAARSGVLDKDIGRELYAMSRGDPAGASGNKQAQQIAEILNKYQSLLKDRLNRAGAWIGHYDGYITRTTHDPAAIYRATRDGWVSDIMPLLDQARTFEGTNNPKQFLNGVWGALVTGVHLSDEGGIGFKDPAFTGPGNMAKQLSQSRVLHFKDADSWMAYQKKYGTSGTLLQQVLRSFDRGAKQEALLTRWGTNPRAELQADIRWMKERYRDSDPLAVQKLSQQEQRLINLFGYLDGANNRPVHAQAAQLAAGARNISSMAKLGSVLFTHLSSAVTKAAELRYNGVNLLEGYRDFIGSFFHGLAPEQAKDLNDLILASIDGAHSALLAPGWIDDSVPGTLSKMSNTFFRMTGLSYTLDGQKKGAAAVMARHLGRMVDKSYDQLPEATLRQFQRYDISEQEWDAVRSAPNHFQMNGRTFLTPDAAHRTMLPDAARDNLALKLHAYYSDVADQAIITPGIGDREFLTRGTRPGTVEGEALRFIAQFKTWPTAAVRQGLGRELYGGQGVGGAISGVLHLAFAGMAFGYARMVLADLSKGVTPRDPNSPATWLAALAQGGGAGILGDFLFGQQNRFGGGLSDTMLGPVLGESANGVMTIWNNLKDYAAGDRTKLKDIPPEMLRLGLNNTPFVNLFYARSALNYLFLNSMMETLNPGYLRRMQSSLHRNTGQSYLSPQAPLVGWMNPANHLHTFGR